MPSYDYRCPEGHVTTCSFKMGDAPEVVECDESRPCGLMAQRVYSAPIALFNGPGFYATDYAGRYDRKRRKNAGDDLPLPTEAAITRAEGAEYDPPKRVPGGVVPGPAHTR